MNEGRIYSREELAVIRAEACNGAVPGCPRCHTPLLPRPVESNPEVAYRRARVWWLCPGCRRSAVVDARGKKEPRANDSG